jgi:hypothetical protein
MRPGAKAAAVTCRQAKSASMQCRLRNACIQAVAGPACCVAANAGMPACCVAASERMRTTASRPTHLTADGDPKVMASAASACCSA